MYKLLVENGFTPNYEAEHWEIMQPFIDADGKKVRGIKYTPDFPIEINGLTVIIETKGRANDSWSLRLKLIKKYMAEDARLSKAKFVMPRNQQHCKEVIEILKHYRDTNIFLEWTPDKIRRKLKKSIDEYKTRLQSNRRGKLLTAEACEQRPKTPKVNNRQSRTN